MSELSAKLNQTEETLVQVTVEDNITDTKLDALREDAQKLERTVQELLDQVEFIKNSDIRGEESREDERLKMQDSSKNYTSL